MLDNKDIEEILKGLDRIEQDISLLKSLTEEQVEQIAGLINRLTYLVYRIQIKQGVYRGYMYWHKSYFDDIDDTENKDNITDKGV